MEDLVNTNIGPQGDKKSPREEEETLLLSIVRQLQAPTLETNYREISFDLADARIATEEAQIQGILELCGTEVPADPILAAENEIDLWTKAEDSAIDGDWDLMRLEILRFSEQFSSYYHKTNNFFSRQAQRALENLAHGLPTPSDQVTPETIQ